MYIGVLFNHLHMYPQHEQSNLNVWMVSISPPISNFSRLIIIIITFKIQTDHLIPARWPDLVIINKIKRGLAELWTLLSRSDHRVHLKESEMKDKYLDLVRELKKTVEHESDGDTNYKRLSLYSHQRIDTGTWGRRNKRTCEDHPSNCIFVSGQNTKKSPGDLRRLAVA